MLVNDDTRAFLKNVDYALIISRASVTKYSQFDMCAREIAEHMNVLGVVLNACWNRRARRNLTAPRPKLDRLLCCCCLANMACPFPLVVTELGREDQKKRAQYVRDRFCQRPW